MGVAFSVHNEWDIKAVQATAALLNPINCRYGKQGLVLLLLMLISYTHCLEVQCEADHNIVELGAVTLWVGEESCSVA